MFFNSLHNKSFALSRKKISQVFKNFSEKLKKPGRLIVIDDYASIYSSSHKIFDRFKTTWMAKSLVSVYEMETICSRYNLKLVMKKNLEDEYQINTYNYNNKKVIIKDEKIHQGFIGSFFRRNLYIDKFLEYWLLVFEHKI